MFACQGGEGMRLCLSCAEMHRKYHGSGRAIIKLERDGEPFGSERIEGVEPAARSAPRVLRCPDCGARLSISEGAVRCGTCGYPDGPLPPFREWRKLALEPRPVRHHPKKEVVY